MTTEIFNSEYKFSRYLRKNELESHIILIKFDTWIWIEIFPQTQKINLCDFIYKWHLEEESVIFWGMLHSFSVQIIKESCDFINISLDLSIN